MPEASLSMGDNSGVTSEKSRLVVVEQLYYQQRNRPPLMVSSRMLTHPGSQEQPYDRLMQVGIEYEVLDLAWLQKLGCSVLWLENQSKTKEDVLEVGVIPEFSVVGIPVMRVAPMTSSRFSPVKHDSLYLRAVGPNPIQVRLVAIPS